MNPVAELFQIEHPIVQGGMVWCSGWKLASAVSNAGALGLLGSGSMNPQLLEEHIIKCKNATSKPFGVNIPLLYPHAKDHIETCIRNGIKIVFTSAGNPDTYTALLKSHGIIVVHVIANSKFAIKAQNAGVDAIVAEGFEAGGHNGREETSTFCLIPQIKKIASVPLIAAGGIYDGKSWLAAQILGADAVQLGSRFAACEESSAHTNYKDTVRQATEGSTQLTLKKLTPVRMLKNAFYQQIANAENSGSSAETLKEILGKGRSKKGILEGDLEEGEMEIGQVSALIEKPETASQIIQDLLQTYQKAKENLYV
ncbi:MAG: nitronate monooxygenase [Bacteroidia bacterium]|nr:nitronate monooxygenase [Bacteroidia bacterium]MCF8448086.1 nitronate monooxygenase [Bacteroidia bacterium]